MRASTAVTWALVVVALAAAVVAWRMGSHGSGVTVVVSGIVSEISSWFLGAAVGIAFANRDGSRGLFIAMLAISTLVFSLAYVTALE